MTVRKLAVINDSRIKDCTDLNQRQLDMLMHEEAMKMVAVIELII